MPGRRALLSGILLVVALLACAAAASASSLGRQRSTVERLAPERLAALTREVEALRSARRDLEPLPGLVDLRAILHAHAEDAAHTAGTRIELLAEARAAGVDVVLLSDHVRPPRDFVEDSWRGMHHGVLFVPGAETADGFLLHPDRSVMEHLGGERAKLLEVVTAGSGLAFLSHVEDHERPSLDGLTGMEIYNRHADAKDDNASMVTLMGWMTDPDGLAQLRRSLELWPDALFAAQYDYPELYLEVWDRATRDRQVVGVAANDCHHNQVFLVKKIDQRSVRLGTVVDADDDMRVVTAEQRPRIPELVAGFEPGEVVARLDFDPYRRSMGFVSTHLLATERSEPAVRAALRAGHVYVSHDWLADPTGFRFVLEDERGERIALLGEETAYRDGLRLAAQLPLSARVRLLRDGEEVAVETGDRFLHRPSGPGVYRLEAWLDLDGEARVWIYSNPIYLR